MARKTDMTARLLLMAAAAYTLTSLISLTAQISEAESARDEARQRVFQLQESIAQLEGEALLPENAAGDELKMVFAGEKTILFSP